MIDLAHVSPWLLLLAPLVVVLAYTVFGLSGFGSTAVSVPILAHFLPVSFLVPLMALLDCASSSFIGTVEREHVSRSELKWLVPVMFAGFAVGATILVRVPDHYLRVALGVFAMAIGGYSIANPGVHASISRLWVVPVGLVGGAVATVFGAGGPIYATYLSARLGDKRQVRATTSALISISAFSRAVIYALSGLLLNAATGMGVIFLAPFVWVGLRLGSRIHVGLTQEQMRRVVGAMLVFTGLSLVARLVLQALAP
ncbi:MAG TPA: sulfite exporter TauE/SafE family protein [Usitatibacter sp.]|nr:sulfite exporter TauE/SafE family protein [Usitatibacter sp.]